MITQKHKPIGIKCAIIRVRNYFFLLFIITAFGCQTNTRIESPPNTRIESPPKTFNLSSFQLYCEGEIVLIADPELIKIEKDHETMGKRFTAQAKERLFAAGLTKTEMEEADLVLRIIKRTSFSTGYGQLNEGYKWVVAVKRKEVVDHEFKSLEDLLEIIDALSLGKL